jgi:hypothetical protein
MGQSTGDSPITGTLTVTSATQLSAGQACISVCVQCDPSSSNNLYVGNAAAQNINLKPGQAITIACSNLNKVYVAGNGGAAVCNWLAVQ